MGRIWMPGGGGGADLDAITAGAGDVLAGKVIVDKGGNPLTGTMPNWGAVNQSLAINGSYTIPAGYHNGSGKVTRVYLFREAHNYTGNCKQNDCSGQQVR